jgi:hypothetical protein
MRLGLRFFGSRRRADLGVAYGLGPESARHPWRQQPRVIPLLSPRKVSARPARKTLVSALIALVCVAALLGYWSQPPGGEPDSVGPTLADLCISYLVL